MSQVWVLDDDKSIRWVFEKALAKANITFECFSNTNEAINKFNHEKPQAIISDIRMPGESGIDFLTKVKNKFPDIPIIIMTAYSDLDTAVTAFQKGAFEYIAKPFDISKVVNIIQQALESNNNKNLKGEELGDLPEIIGQAKSMQDVFRAIGRLSQSNAMVLLNGESGSGKELVAKAIHKNSHRKESPFIAINTAAIPNDLLEAELFGFEKGAFTGANAQRKGKFEQADQGTLFLDEIGDMPIDLQTRLLRVLSEGQFYRVGGQDLINVDVRVIAATHQDLETLVKSGQFREDLFHRLNVIRIKVPPLRERVEDIPLLSQYFLNKSANQLNVKLKSLSPEVIEYFKNLYWQGNVRQLENICHWLTVMAPGNVINVSDLPAELIVNPYLQEQHLQIGKKT
jgi:two-component system nitrogen regulation response regulator GlnG